MLKRSTIQLLRFHFSLFLLPVYLFALSEAVSINAAKAIVAFIILHLLVYPASNGYNSYMDRDVTPVGGLSSPLMPSRQLYFVSAAMDLLAVLGSFFISRTFVLGILLYITASRAYSYKGIRLKKFAIIGFLTVFIFQGAVVFYITCQAVQSAETPVPLLSCLISSCLIGALYPLTQIYQHDEDRKDGVQTISMLFGKRGTFIFSMMMFLTATFLIYLRLQQENKQNHFVIYLLIMLPVVLYFLFWMRKVWMNSSEASFVNSMRMNLLATICTSAFFITITFLNH
ncbi:MAG: UbiA family prenyltransferase [Flavisolibacter sp.]